MMPKAKVAFQPIVCSKTTSRKAYEVLARFPGSSGLYEGPYGHVSASQWASLDLKIIGMLAKWVAVGNRLRHPLYINVSAGTLSCDNAFEAWEEQYKTFRFYQQTPVMLEINEFVSADAIEKRWSRLSECGLGLALDDFGSQNASLERLQAFPWAVCKFESDTLAHEDSQAALRHAEKTNMLTIVERIETPEDARHAFQAGVSLHQGYFYGFPQVVALDYAVTAPTIQLREVAS